MSGDIVLAVDLGASSGRVLAAEIMQDRIQLHDVHRFDNVPVHVGRRLHWDIVGLWNDVEEGLRKAAQRFGDRIASVGVDTWGVDYVLLDRNDDLVGPAFCYRDSRTSGLMHQAFDRLPRKEIFANSGLQFMEINTLYQMWSMRVENSPQLDIAENFLMIPDFFHWQLSGHKVNETTNASTTQMLDPNTRDWSNRILDAFNLPRHLFLPLVQPGTNLGPVVPKLRARTGLPESCQVIVPATHDTGSAVIAVPADGFAESAPKWCYISSGTWSLMGVELASPVLSDTCHDLNFTNEGGANGSVRLLKNIAGLWPFQQLRASWLRKGIEYSWSELTNMASQSEALSTFIDIEHPMFVAPEDMLTDVEKYLRGTEQSIPDAGGLARALLESLAMRYRTCLEWLESILGYKLETIHIVGGGVQNQLLCQMTADACNRRVVAGPVEATALGNVAAQCIALGRFSSISEVRKWMRAMPDIQTYEPKSPEAWTEAASRFQQVTSKFR